MGVIECETPRLDPPQPTEALIEEARRRQRRRRRMIALIAALVVAAACAVVFTTGASSAPRSPRQALRPPHHAVAVVTIPGSDTTLVIWPGNTCCEVPNTVFVDDLATGVVTQRVVPPMAGGDYPVPFVAVGKWFVYDGEAANPGIYSLPQSFRHQPRLLGQATWFVPGVGDQVLLAANPFSTRASTVRTVDVPSGRLGPRVTLPAGTLLVEGTRGGLLLFSRHGLELLRPDRTLDRIANLSQPSDDFVGGDAQVVAYGSGCRWAEGYGFPNDPVGYRLCSALHTVNLVTGRRLTFPAPVGTLGWQPQGIFDAVGAIDPTDTMLAASAGISHDHEARGRLFVLSLRSARQPVAVPGGFVPLSDVTAWSRAGSWLFYETGGRRLRGFQVSTGRATTLGVHLSDSGVFALASIDAR